MNRNEITFDQIKKFVADELLISSIDLTSETCLNRDLLIVGDDADELLEAFSKRFEIDVSNFDFHEYFTGEVTSEMHYYLASCSYDKTENIIYKKFLGLQKAIYGFFARKKEFKPLSLGDLWSAAKAGRWNP